MFHWAEEGEWPKQGVSAWRPGSSCGRGVKVRVGRLCFGLRFSRYRRLHAEFYTVPKHNDALGLFFEN